MKERVNEWMREKEREERKVWAEWHWRGLPCRCQGCKPCQRRSPHPVTSMRKLNGTEFGEKVSVFPGVTSGLLSQGGPWFWLFIYITNLKNSCTIRLSSAVISKYFNHNAHEKYSYMPSCTHAHTYMTPLKQYSPLLHVRHSDSL